MRPSVEIVVPTYLNAVGAQQLIISIAKYTDLSKDVRLTLVANGAPEEARHLSELGIPLTMLWFDEPQGFSKAVNAGIRESTADMVVVLNDDCCLLSQPRNQWLDLMLAPMLADERVGITGPHSLWDPSTEHEFVVFYCAMLRRTMLDQLGGGLDESFSPFYGEDISLCIEAERAGWKWVQVPEGEERKLIPVPNSEALPPWKQMTWVGTFPMHHEGEVTLGQLPEHVPVVERNQAILRRRYGPADISRALAIEGWMSEVELRWLAQTVRDRGKIA
jgi:GT2 family glycosyltransferase